MTSAVTSAKLSSSGKNNKAKLSPAGELLLKIMKKILYKIFALFFNICRVAPIKVNRAVLLAPHPGGSHDSTGAVEEYLKEKGRYELIRINVPRSGIKNYIRFFLRDSRILATAKYIFLNDNFMPMADLHFSKETVITQLWHGEGAFKKFGLLTDIDEETAQRLKKCTEKLTYITCTSENIRDIYADAFGADREKVLPLGSPRLDYLLKEQDSGAMKEEFYKAFPLCRGKKLVLYAPTFRDTPERDKALLDSLDVNYFNESTQGGYALLIKLHPRVHSAKIPENAVDVTGYDTAKLTLICDMLITDYSSICMDFALLNKPCLFYAFDLDEYEKERSFCKGYEDYVPGKVIKDFKEIPDAVKDCKIDEKAEAFLRFNFDFIDDMNTERILKAVLE